MTNTRLILVLLIAGSLTYLAALYNEAHVRGAKVAKILEQIEDSNVKLDTDNHLKLIGFLEDEGISVSEMNQLSPDGETRFSIIKYIFIGDYKEAQEMAFIKELPLLLTNKVKNRQLDVGS